MQKAALQGYSGKDLAVPRIQNQQKLLVLSDTHGRIKILEAVLNWAEAQEIRAAVFLGDGLDDFSCKAALNFNAGWKKVRGNGDFFSTFPELDTLDFGEKRFFLCHGHRYSPYSNFKMLAEAARSVNADAALFGHLHVPVLQKEGNILLINPGSIGRPRSSAGSTFAVIDCVPDKPINTQFYKVDSTGKIDPAVLR